MNLAQWNLPLLAVAQPMIAAFIITGIASIFRLRASLRKPDAPGSIPATAIVPVVAAFPEVAPGAADAKAWLRAAWLGTAGWWGLTAALAAAACVPAFE